MKIEPFSPRFYAIAGAGLAACAIAAVAVAFFWSSPRLPWSTASPEAEPGALLGGEPDAYSATVTRTFAGASETRTEVIRVARKGDWTRQEWNDGGRRFASIVRPDLGIVFVVDLDGNVYVEQPLAGEAAADGEVTGDEVERLVTAGEAVTVAREKIGAERLAGYACDVYRSRIESPLGGVSESKVWEAPDLGGLVLRSELVGPDGSRATTELTDLSLEPDPTVFEVPPTAQRVDALGVR